MDNRTQHLINFNATADNDVRMEDVKILATSYLMSKIGLYAFCILFTTCKMQLRVHSQLRFISYDYYVNYSLNDGLYYTK